MNGSNGNGGHKAPWALPEDDDVAAGIFSAPAANGNAFMQAPQAQRMDGPPMLPAPSVYQPQAFAQTMPMPGKPGAPVPFGPQPAPAGNPQAPWPPRGLSVPGSGQLTKKAFGNPDVELSGHMLGLSTLLVGIATIVGYRYGGVWGGLAGSLFGGSAINGYRAGAHAWEGTQQSDHEAIVSGTYALLAAGLGGYILYRTRSPGEPEHNPPERERPRENSRRSCGIRPVY